MKISKNLFLGFTPALVMITLATLGVLSSHDSHADTTTSATASVTVASACTMSQDSSTFVPHTATIPAGTYRDEIGLTTFNVVCNDASGYSIYAVGYSNNEFGNTTLLYEDRTMTGIDIITGTNTSGSTSNWAMKLKTTTGNTPAIQSDTNGSFSSYHIVPSTYTKVATLTPITTTNQNSSFGATYAAYAAGTQTAGTYNGKVKYTLVHPANGEVQDGPKSATARCISYWPNAGNDVIDNMGDQCSYNNNQENVTLWPTNFKREGYGFAGWTNKFDWVLNENDANGNGTGANAGYHIYGPMQSITTPADMTTKGLSLYAVWVKSQGNLQGWSCPSDSVMPVSNVTALTDTRDNQTYAVAKLADGNCWMIENLRLADKTSNNTAIELSSTNTNSPSLPLTNTWWYSTDNDSDTPTTSNSLSTPVSPSSSTPWCTTYNNANCDDQSMLSNNNTTSTIANQTGTSQNIYSYGNYYNWYSATAGNGKYSTTGDSTSVGGDLCSTGWRLPKGGNKTKIESNDNEFWNLTVVALNNDTKPANYDSSMAPYYNVATEAGPVADLLRSFPNNFLYSGYVYGSSANVRGNVGYYWSSTVSSGNYAYGLTLYRPYVYPGTNHDYKYRGLTVRCLAGS